MIMRLLSICLIAGSLLLTANGHQAFAKDGFYVKDGVYVANNRPCYKVDSPMELGGDKDIDDLVVKTQNGVIYGFYANSNLFKVDNVRKISANRYEVNIGIQPTSSRFAYQNIDEGVDIYEINNDESFTLINTRGVS